jgi:hypothetical protein
MIEKQSPQQPVGKIDSGLQGLGAVTPEMVEERARELARIDGRTQVTEADRILARGELQGTIPPQNPEADPDLENVEVWDEPPAASGVRIGKVLPDDETSFRETLVEEGMEEADHETRLEASEENPPEEG